MEKYEKEILQSYIDGEKAVLKSLEKVYSDALEKIDEKIAYLLSLTGEDNRHAIYQAEYQKAVRKQIQAALDTLQADEFETVSDYLTQSYNDGFTATMYALHQQGVPLTIPIDHSQVEKAIKIDTKLKEDLYTTLGVDIANLKKTITREISRGVASGMLYSEITKNIANATRAPKSRVMTIVRTEGGRIQEQATMDAAFKAQEKGANVVKQWSAIRDGSTRPTHRQLHNQIRELDKPFEIAGKKAMQPHDFGDPAEDCNCRCTTMIRARWALDDDELERMQKEAREQGLLAEDSKQLGHAQAKNIAEFRKWYLKDTETLKNQGESGIMVSRKMSNVSTGGKRNETPLSDSQVDEAKKAALQQGYEGDILYSAHSNTSFHGSREGEEFHYLVIGTDAYPAEKNGGTANEMVSLNACMAHEVVGHYEAWKKGTMQSNEVLEEVQASIRASKFGVGLTTDERKILYRDAMDRMKHAGIELRDVEDDLDIWER